MQTFKTERKAKEFLIARIVEQADSVGEPLTEVERKMLYFSETGWTLPDMMAVNEEFEQTCDNDAYEQKILGLANSARADDVAAGGDATDNWNAAVKKLSAGDHYLQVLINQDLVSSASGKRPPGDFRRLLFTAFAVVVAIFALTWLFDTVRGYF
jgi:hypothetical protein